MSIAVTLLQGAGIGIASYGSLGFLYERVKNEHVSNLGSWLLTGLITGVALAAISSLAGFAAATTASFVAIPSSFLINASSSYDHVSIAAAGTIFAASMGYLLGLFSVPLMICGAVVVLILIL